MASFRKLCLRAEEQGTLPISFYNTDYLTTKKKQIKDQIPHEHKTQTKPPQIKSNYTYPHTVISLHEVEKWANYPPGHVGTFMHTELSLLTWSPKGDELTLRAQFCEGPRDEGAGAPKHSSTLLLQKSVKALLWTKVGPTQIPVWNPSPTKPIKRWYLSVNEVTRVEPWSRRISVHWEEGNEDPVTGLCKPERQFSPETITLMDPALGCPSLQENRKINFCSSLGYFVLAAWANKCKSKSKAGEPPYLFLLRDPSLRA